MEREELLCLLSLKSNYIARLLRIMGVPENDIEDVRSDIVVSAIKSITTLHDADHIEPWLRTIAIRNVSKYFSKRKNRVEVSNLVRTEAGEEIDIYELVADERTTELIFQEAERREAVAMLLDTIPETAKRIIQMRFWGDYKFSEIAMILNVNENTVKSIYRRSLKKLRKNYETIFGKEEPYE